MIRPRDHDHADNVDSAAEEFYEQFAMLRSKNPNLDPIVAALLVVGAQLDERLFQIQHELWRFNEREERD